MTDWQQPFALLLTQARGMSVIHETIYEDRFGYTQDLNRMGADTGLFTSAWGSFPAASARMSTSIVASSAGQRRCTPPS